MDNEERDRHSGAGCVGVMFFLFGLGMLTVEPVGMWTIFAAAWAAAGVAMIVWHLITIRAHEQKCSKCGRRIPMRSLVLYSPRPHQLCPQCRALTSHSRRSSAPIILPALLFAMLGIAAFLAAAYAAIHVPITKLTTPEAMSAIERRYVHPETLDERERRTYDFYARWILGNERVVRESLARVRRLAVFGFGAGGSVFWLTGAWIWWSGRRVDHSSADQRKQE